MLPDLLICLTFFAFSFPFGFIFLNRLKLAGVIGNFELIVFSEILGVTISALLVYLAGFFLPLLPVLAILYLISALLISLYPIRLKELSSWNLPKKDLYKILFFNIFWTLILWYVVNETHLKQIGDTFNGSPSTFGDFPYHLGIITNFAYGNNFPPVNPIAPFTRLSYHILADFLSSINLILGSKLIGAIVYPSVFLGVLIVNSLYLLTIRITKNTTIGIITPFIFLFNGGIGFIKVLIDKVTIENIFGGVTRFAHVPELGVEYPNILTEIMMAERAIVLGIALWIASIYFLYIWYKNENQYSLYMAGLATGLLPYANVYGFLVNFFIFVLIFINKLFTKKWLTRVKEWTVMAIVICVPAIPFLIWIIPQLTSGGSFTRVSINEWPPMNVPFNYLFWPINFGVVIPLAILAFFAEVLGKKEKFFLFIISIVAVVSHVIVFQPYSWDNNRFIIYPYIAISILASVAIAKAIESHKFILKLSGAVLFSAAILTGVLVLINDSQMHYSLFNKQDFVRSEKIRQVTPENAIIITSRNHNNIVSSLAGRRITLGFEGYLWTQGVQNTLEVENYLKEVYSCSPETDAIIKKLKADYIMITGWEINDYPDLNTECLTSKFKTVLSEENFMLLNVHLTPDDI